MYIHEKNNWTQFYWNEAEVNPLVERACRETGRLYGRLDALGVDARMQVAAENVAEDVLRSSEIEGVLLNIDEVRSSVARNLGVESMFHGVQMPSRGGDAVVGVMMRAMAHYDQPVDKALLCAWHSALFESGFSGGVPVLVGQYRQCAEQIVSGAFGRERVHYVAPAPERVEEEMQQFLSWFNTPASTSQIIRSAIAHLWFVSIHPFEDGNGRISRLLGEMCLARGDKSTTRFYSIAAAINRDKKNYYRCLETVQRGNGDITVWLVWYIETLVNAVNRAEEQLDCMMYKALFWQRHAGVELSERQRTTINCLLDKGTTWMMSRTWAHLAKCSSDTALRDLQDLQTKGLVAIENPEAKRYTYYFTE